MSEEKTPRRLVGLQYTPGEGLPTVIAKACGEQAEQALRAHNAYHGPPLIENPALARELYRLPVDAPIGRELFDVVAALLVHVYAVDATLEAQTDA